MLFVGVLVFCCNRILFLLLEEAEEEKILEEDTSRLEDRVDNRHTTITVICLFHVMTYTIYYVLYKRSPPFYVLVCPFVWNEGRLSLL